MLITRPNHDLLTTYLYCYSKSIVSFCDKKSVRAVDLDGKKSNKKIFDSYVAKNKFSFIFLNGHGGDNVVCGYANEVLVDKFVSGFSKVIFYCRSCRSAVNLGKVLVDGGAKAFIGYDKDFYVLLTRNKNTKPLLDKTANLYLEPSNLVALSIIKGNSVGLANKKSKDLFKKNIMEVAASSMSDKNLINAYLFHDLKSQVVIGDVEAKI